MKKKIIITFIFFVFTVFGFSYNFEPIQIDSKASIVLSQLNKKGYRNKVEIIKDTEITHYAFYPEGDIALYNGCIEVIDIFIKKEVIVGYQLILTKPNPDNLDENKGIVLEYIVEEELKMEKNREPFVDIKEILDNSVETYYGYNEKMEAKISIGSLKGDYFVYILATRI